MSSLQLFEFDDEWGVDTELTPDGEPAVCASDLAKAFGLKRPANAFARIDDDYKVALSRGTPGGEQRMIYLREPGVYEFLATVRLRRDNPNYERIRKFRRWLYSEVLPSVFRARGLVVGPTLAEKRAAFDEALNIARLLGYDGNEALIVANRGVVRNLGVDLMAEFRPALPSPNNEGVLTPTELGKRLGEPASAQIVNKRLEMLGLQRKERGRWRLTPEGKKVGQYYEVPMSHGQASTQQIKWAESVVDRLDLS